MTSKWLRREPQFTAASKDPIEAARDFELAKKARELINKGYERSRLASALKISLKQYDTLRKRFPHYFRKKKEQ